MNSNCKRISITAVLLAAMLLVAVWFTLPAAAQSTYQGKAFWGKVTLPYETHWGQAVLPAGDYTLSATAQGGATMITVRNARNGLTVAFVEPTSIKDSTEGSSALLIGARGTKRVVHSLRVAELGLVFISDPALAREFEAQKEARKLQAVPVTVAKN